jgi:hypothetical protein
MLGSELGRLWQHREFTDTQAGAGFLIADIYRLSDSAESAKKRGDATAAAKRGGPNAAERDRKALDALLSEYPPKVSEAVIELCVFNRAVDWKLRPEIRQVLDDVVLLFSDALRQLPINELKSVQRSGSSPAPRAVTNRTAEGTEVRPDFDPEVEAFKKVIAALRPDLDADGRARVIDEFVALRDREEFRQEKMQDNVGRRQR